MGLMVQKVIHPISWEIQTNIMGIEITMKMDG